MVTGGCSRSGHGLDPASAIATHTHGSAILCSSLSPGGSRALPGPAHQITAEADLDELITALGELRLRAGPPWKTLVGMTTPS